MIKEGLCHGRTEIDLLIHHQNLECKYKSSKCALCIVHIVHARQTEIDYMIHCIGSETVDIKFRAQPCL